MTIDRVSVEEVPYMIRQHSVVRYTLRPKLRKMMLESTAVFPFPTLMPERGINPKDTVRPKVFL